jgi:hypothetical protein
MVVFEFLLLEYHWISLNTDGSNMGHTEAKAERRKQESLFSPLDLGS